MTQVSVRAFTSVAGLCLVQNHTRAATRYLAFLAQGVMVVIAHQQFTVRVSDFGDQPVQLLKHTTLGIALPLPAHTRTVGPESPQSGQS